MKVITQITVKNKRRVKRPFFYFEELKNWERYLFVFYAILTVVSCFLTLVGSGQGKQDVLAFYGGGTQLCFFMFLYKSLRNLTAYLVWCAFGLVHFILYLLIKNPEVFVLKNTIPLLLLFQPLRYLSLKLQYREFVMPEKRGFISSGKRKDSEIDFLLFALYMGAWVGLSVLAMQYA